MGKGAGRILHHGRGRWVGARHGGMGAGRVDYGGIAFKGTFRDYQQRVLDHADTYRDDGRIHVVAAPGSGKTVLGLELIRRLGAPALVLSPTTAIRNQWCSRFEQFYLPDGASYDAYRTIDPRSPRLITSITYQTLHAAFKGLTDKGVDEGADETDDLREGASSPADYRGFDLVRTLQDAGVSTICLDEAHHLRSQWHKALVAFLERMGDVRIIALTATPPYDSTRSEWDRYERLCGPIDEEIFVPELVAKADLCPHQDYVYLTYPTVSGGAVLAAYRAHVEAFCSDAIASRLVERALAAAGLLDEGWRARLDHVLAHAMEFAALLRITHAQGTAIPRELLWLCSRRQKVRGTTARQRIEAKRAGVGSITRSVTTVAELERALQFVVASPDVFGAPIVDELRTLLRSHGLIERAQVCLAANRRTRSLLAASMGKLHAIAQIARAEQESMGPRLRMLVLTDYIRAELAPTIGSGTGTGYTVMGAVPIFEVVRGALGSAARLALLTGSLAIVPTGTRRELERRACGLHLSFFALSGTPDYLRVSAPKLDQLVSLMTGAFEEGTFTVLVGTKSLLGEGWDSPSINTLVLASFVGSFMLSNQMRGRAIRTDPRTPGKTANVWHLVCLEPFLDDEAPAPLRLLLGGLDKDRSPSGSDWDTLVRRFDCFMGPALSRDAIESGIERLSVIQPPYDEEGVRRIDDEMLRRARDRAGMAASWQRCLASSDGAQVARVVRAEVASIPAGALFMNALPLLLLGLLALVAQLASPDILFVSVRASSGHAPLALVALVAFLGVAVLAARGIVLLIRCLDPTRLVTQLAEALLATLRTAGLVTSPLARARVSGASDFGAVVKLAAATMREQEVFARACTELLSPIGNPRYVLVRIATRRGAGRFGRLFTTSFAVPEVLGARREWADALAQELGGRLADIGSFEAVYTRTPEGRAVLWSCCERSFTNKNERVLTWLSS